MTSPFIFSATVIPRSYSARDQSLGFYVVFALADSDHESKTIAGTGQRGGYDAAEQWLREWPSRIEQLMKGATVHYEVEKEDAEEPEIQRDEKYLNFLVSGSNNLACPISVENPPDCRPNGPNEFYPTAKVKRVWEAIVTPALEEWKKNKPTETRLRKLVKSPESYDPNPSAASDLRARNRIESPDRRTISDFAESAKLLRAMRDEKPGWEKCAVSKLQSIAGEANGRFEELAKAAKEKAAKEKAAYVITTSRSDLLDHPDKVKTDDVKALVRALSAQDLSRGATETSRVQRFIDSARTGEHSPGKKEREDQKTPTLGKLFARLHKHPSLARQFRLTLWCKCKVTEPEDWKRSKQGFICVNLPSEIKCLNSGRVEEVPWNWRANITRFEFSPPTTPTDSGWFRPYAADDGTYFDVDNVWRRHHLLPRELWNVTQEDAALGCARASATSGTAPGGVDSAAADASTVLPLTEGFSIYPTPYDLPPTGASQKPPPISAAEDLANRLNKSAKTADNLAKLHSFRREALELGASTIELAPLLENPGLKKRHDELVNIIADSLASESKAAIKVREERAKILEMEFATTTKDLFDRASAEAALSQAHTEWGNAFLTAPDLMRGFTVEVGGIPADLRSSDVAEPGDDDASKELSGKPMDWRSLCWRQVRIKVSGRNGPIFPPVCDPALVEEGFIAATVTSRKQPLVGRVKKYSAPTSNTGADGTETPAHGALDLEVVLANNAFEGGAPKTFIIVAGRPGDATNEPDQSETEALAESPPPTIFYGAFRRLLGPSDVKEGDFVHVVGNGESALEVRIFPVFDGGDVLRTIEQKAGLQVLMAKCPARNNEQFSFGIVSGSSRFLNAVGAHCPLPMNPPSKKEPDSPAEYVPFKQFIAEADRRHFTLTEDDLGRPGALPKVTDPLYKGLPTLPILCAEIPDAMLHWSHLRPETDRVDLLDLPFVTPEENPEEKTELRKWIRAQGTSLRVVRGIVRGVWIEFKAQLVANLKPGDKVDMANQTEGTLPTKDLQIKYNGTEELTLKGHYCHFFARFTDGQWTTTEIKELSPENSNAAERPEDVRGLDKAPLKYPGLDIEEPGSGTLRVEFTPVEDGSVPAEARFALPWELRHGDYVEIVGGGSARVLHARGLPQHPYANVHFVNGVAETIVFADGAFVPKVSTESMTSATNGVTAGFWKLKVDTTSPDALLLYENKPAESLGRRFLAEVISVEFIEKRESDKDGRLKAPVPTGECLITLGAVAGEARWQLFAKIDETFADLHTDLAARQVGDLEAGDCIAFVADYDTDHGHFTAQSAGVQGKKIYCGLFGVLTAADSLAETMALGDDSFFPAMIRTPLGQHRPFTHAADQLPHEGEAAVAATPILLVRNLIEEDMSKGVSALEAETEQVIVSDNTVRWKGWSLAVEQSGEPDQSAKDEASLPGEFQVVSELPSPKELKPGFWLSKLPPLRFGQRRPWSAENTPPHRYVFRLRRVDIAGNHGLDEPIPAAVTTKAVRVPPAYRRPIPSAAPLFGRPLSAEPNDLIIAVSDPTLVPAPQPDPDEVPGPAQPSLPARLVVVSDPIAAPRAENTASDRAYLLPPPLAPDAIIQHGLLEIAEKECGLDAETLIAMHDRSLPPPAGANKDERKWFDGTLAFTSRKLSRRMRHSWNYFPDPIVPSVLLTVADHEGWEISAGEDREVRSPLAGKVEPALLRFHPGNEAPFPVEWTPVAIQLSALPGAAPVRKQAILAVNPQFTIVPCHNVQGHLATIALPAGRRGFAIIKRDGMQESWINIELLHAVTAPVLRPAWSPSTQQSPERPETDTSQVVEGVVSLDAPSTGELRVIAWWNEHWDEGTMEQILRPAQLAVIHDAVAIEPDLIEILEPGAGYGTRAIVVFEDARQTEPVEFQFQNEEERPVLEPVFEAGFLKALNVRKPGVLDRGIPLRVQVKRRPPLSHFGRATASVCPLDGSILGVEVLEKGGWYDSPPYVIFHDTASGSDGHGAEATAVLNGEGGIQEIRIDPEKRGKGYSAHVQVGIYTHRRDLGAIPVPLPSRATAVLALQDGVITGASITHSGGPYTLPPRVKVLDETGTGAELRTELDPQGRVARVMIVAAGARYSPAARIVIANDFGHPLDFRFPMHLAFGDTRERKVFCEAFAQSRDAQLLTDQPELILASGTKTPVRPRISLPHAFHIRSSARPPKPDVAPFTQCFKWNIPPEKRFLCAAAQAPLEIRREAAIRVWLRRPWHITGNERLGVVVLNAEVNTNVISKEIERIIPARMRGLVSRWGYDPVWDATKLPPLRLDDFTNSVGFIPYEDLRDFKDDDERMVGVALHETFYDDRTDQWYADVSLRRPEAGIPFVQLAVVRVQEHASARCMFSEVHLCDMIRLPPDRELRVTRTSGNEFHFLVRGAFEDPARRTIPTDDPAPQREFRVAFRRRSPGEPLYAEGPLANGTSDDVYFSLDDRFHSDDVLVLGRPKDYNHFEGKMKVRFPETGTDECYFRLEECELYPTSEPQRSKAGETSRSTFARALGTWDPFTCAVRCEPPH